MDQVVDPVRSYAHNLSLHTYIFRVVELQIEFEIYSRESEALRGKRLVCTLMKISLMKTYKEYYESSPGPKLMLRSLKFYISNLGNVYPSDFLRKNVARFIGGYLENPPRSTLVYGARTRKQRMCIEDLLNKTQFPNDAERAQELAAFWDEVAEQQRQQDQLHVP